MFSQHFMVGFRQLFGELEVHVDKMRDEPSRMISFYSVTHLDSKILQA